MKPFVVLLLAVLSVISLSSGSYAQQNCFSAVVLSSTNVELHMRCPITPEINRYGLSFQRRNANDTAFSDLPGSFCPAAVPPEPFQCSFLDTTVTPGVWYYRVKLIALDGTVSYPLPPIQVVVDTIEVVYPLHIGNRWNWGFERRITDTLRMPNGRLYAKLYDPLDIQSEYQRYEAGKVYAWNFRGSTDQVIYDFTRSQGDTVATIYRATDTMDIILTYRGEALLFGTVRRQWGFWFDVRRMIDEEIYQVITDSIGVTHEEGMWFSLDLIGAIINGRRYGTITDISQSDQSMPTEFHLSQNYPNPFNSSTRIRFSVGRENRGMGEAEKVVLKVFDVLGQEVATLVNEAKPPGEYSVTFDAHDLPSGIYFYQLRAADFMATRKLVLIR